MIEQPVMSVNDKFVLGSIELRNRSVVAPLTRISAKSDGTLTDRVVEYYRIFGVGGFGLVITEGSYVDEKSSQTYLNQPGLANSAHMKSWRRVCQALHGEGAAVIAQLQHSGPQQQGSVYPGRPKGPSAVAARGEQLSMYRGYGSFPVPEVLTSSEIDALRRDFVASALRARDAGFDGVEVHGANGYLLDAFHTDYLNLRKDDHGGSAESRVRLTAQIVADVKEAVGADLIVGVRISQGKVSDPLHKWAGEVGEAKVIFGALKATGADYIHTTEYRADAPAFPGSDDRSLVQLAKEFAPGLSIIANGHIDDESTANHVLKTHQADLVSIGRAALSNRDWPLKIKQKIDVQPPFNAGAFGELAEIQDWEIDAHSLLSATHNMEEICP